MSGSGDRDDERGDEEERGAGESAGGPRFVLPPIRLPDAVFPSDLDLTLPPPKVARRFGRSGRSVLAVALAVDLADAALALAGVGPVLAWGRVVAGLGLAALFTGVSGAFYAWEAVALALGVEWVTAVPSLTLLVLYRGRE